MLVPADQVSVQIARGPRGIIAVYTDSFGYEVRAAVNGTSGVKLRKVHVFFAGARLRSGAAGRERPFAPVR